MNYMDIKKTDLLNGEGIRVSLWVTGCHFKCKGCHNKELWSKEVGYKYTQNTEDYILELLSNEYVNKGLSILGGEPLEEYNYPTILNLCKEVKKLYPKKSIWLWTGYNIEFVKKLDIINYVDVVVDGQFIEEEKEELLWRGSKNQNVIFLNK
ncbi:MAG: anaerobic ribonucleoside-triphosphate reductase activating protein [Cetobacterium sp.]